MRLTLMPCAALMLGFFAGSAERGALLGAEVPVEQGDERQRDERAGQDSGGNVTEERTSENLSTLTALFAAMPMMRRFME